MVWLFISEPCLLRHASLMKLSPESEYEFILPSNFPVYNCGTWNFVFMTSYMWSDWSDSSPLCCVLVTGLMCRLKAPLCPERCTAGTGASMTTGTTKRHPKAALCIWSTAAHGRTVTPPARPSETSSQDRRWMSFSFSCTWALMCRRWPSSRAWIPASYWACSAVAAKRDIHTLSISKLSPNMAGWSLWTVSHARYLQLHIHSRNPFYLWFIPLFHFTLVQTSVTQRVSYLSHNPFPHHSVIVTGATQC